MSSVKKDLYTRIGIYGAHDEDPVPAKVRRETRIYQKKGGRTMRKGIAHNMKCKEKEY